MRFISLTSQYQGISLASNLYEGPEKSQCSYLDFGRISRSDTLTCDIISNLNLSSLSFLSLYCYLSILS